MQFLSSTFLCLFYQHIIINVIIIIINSKSSRNSDHIIIILVIITMIIVTIITVIIVDVYDCSFVTGFALIITTYLFYHTVLRDYCLVDDFIAECPIGSIIMMEEARFGRMQLGTCLTRDIGYMDCSRYAFISFYCIIIADVDVEMITRTHFGQSNKSKCPCCQLEI